MEEKFQKIVDNFALKGKVVSFEIIDMGHINSTRKIIVDLDGKRKSYLLQKINHNVFKNIDDMMSNIMLVTEFNRQKVKERGGKPSRESLTLIPTKDGKPYYHDAETDGYYRIYRFIENTVTLQAASSTEGLYECAVAFGQFAKQLIDFDVSLIKDTIPNFHNTKKRYADFVASVEKDAKGRAQAISEDIKFLLDRKDYAGRIVDLLESGEMPTRITHNDTKLNNVMLDATTLKSLVVVDLDTIMKGSICYDFGDGVRGGCRYCDEDEPNLSKVKFELKLFETFAKGYLSALGDSITPIERENLAFSCLLLTFELAMRFLGDYLDGDEYFRVKYSTQNLDRARVHIKLLQDMEAVLPQMEEIIKKY